MVIADNGYLEGFAGLKHAFVSFIWQLMDLYENLYLWLLDWFQFKREDNKMFLVECPGGFRTREVLEKIILEHVELGTTIYTDCWKAYNHLEDLGKFWRLFWGGFCIWSLLILFYFQGYIRRSVNHDKWYVDPVTGVHTNRIESR